MSVQTGSTTVTGANVDFAASSRVGDSFVGPDGVNYEVANVASSTVISILPAYKGPTVSGAAYAIMPVQGYDKMLSDAFNALSNQFGPKLAALGTTGNYEILPVEKGGTGADTLGTAARANIGTSPGNVMPVGAGGWLGPSVVDSTNANNARATGFYSLSGTLNSPQASAQMLSSDWGANPQWQSQLVLGITENKMFMRSILKTQTSATPWVEFYHTGNTTRAADGTLKAI
ncbi:MULTISPECIES: hypothetical protein [unclassified Pseudomonas]|uniref:hypothetical protein n=1 Tax=unclassified Pseudomonas TaxID=196821 RepID=UPI002108A45B|nr:MULTISPECIES: hypothetical protein [unclassified Pseudomonas]